MTSGAGGRLLNKKQELNTKWASKRLAVWIPRPAFSSGRGSS